MSRRIKPKEKFERSAENKELWNYVANFEFSRPKSSSGRLVVRDLLYDHKHQVYGLCYTSCGALAGTRNISVGSP